MLAPSLAQLAIVVDAPSVWLPDLLPHPQLRLHPRTPRALRRCLQAHVADRHRGTAGPAALGQGVRTRGWLCTRIFDGQAHPPLMAGDTLEAGAWIVEFAFARRSWMMALFGLSRRRDRSWRGLESRARAFLEADLREVEQWVCEGFPEVCVTIGRAGAVAVAAQAARRAILTEADEG